MHYNNMPAVSFILRAGGTHMVIVCNSEGERDQWVQTFLRHDVVLVTEQLNHVFGVDLGILSIPFAVHPSPLEVLTDPKMTRDRMIIYNYHALLIMQCSALKGMVSIALHHHLSHCSLNTLPGLDTPGLFCIEADPEEVQRYRKAVDDGNSYPKKHNNFTFLCTLFTTRQRYLLV